MHLCLQHSWRGMPEVVYPAAKAARTVHLHQGLCKWTVVLHIVTHK